MTKPKTKPKPDELLTIQVKLYASELATFPLHQSKAARVRLQCGLEPLAHGGDRVSGKAKNGKR